MNIDEQRAAIADEALSWVGTPYHHLGRVKGPQGGVDCGMLLYEVFARANVLEPFEIKTYEPQWHMHHDGEQYVDYILQRTNEVAGPPTRIPESGDIVVWKFGRSFSHGAIVSKWPLVVHAYSKLHKVALQDVSIARYLQFVGENGLDKGKPRPMRVFSFKAWC